MMNRTTSESSASASPSSKMWKFSSLRSRMSKNSGKEDKGWSKAPGPASSFDSGDPRSGSLSLNRTNSQNTLLDGTESNHKQLQMLILKMRNTPSGSNHVDAAYKEFTKLKDKCSLLCTAVLSDDSRLIRMPSNTQDLPVRREFSSGSPKSPGLYHDGRSSFSDRSFGETITQTRTGRSSGGQNHEAHLASVRDWKTCLEGLVEAFKTHLAETYKNYERDATPEMVEALFASKRFRKEAINRMRNANVTRVMSADPQFFPRYDIRFRNYEKVKTELSEIRQLLQDGESGISPLRKVEQHSIDPEGDVILEFANVGVEVGSSDPALRLRVSSRQIRDTSPVFARMCGGLPDALRVHEDEDIDLLLPPPPADYTCKDGSRVKLFRMPQHETNKCQSLEILLKAAHGEPIPKEVSFDQFVAVAECSYKYRCSLPLESAVEHDWLPQWMHRGADEMPDGLLMITYTFGLRQLFTRMSKTAILNLTDEQDLQSKPWPQKFKAKIWEVRCAKMDQIYRCCNDTIRDYFRTPISAAEGASETTGNAMRNIASSMLRPPKITSLSSTTRCPKGSHSCDALNLGWLMLVFNQMNILQHIVQPELTAHLPPTPLPPTSLVSLIGAFRKVPSPDAPLHRGAVCDPIPAFRTAMADILNSVTGLTLYDMSGKSHGWGLSRHRMAEPQAVLTRGLDRMAAHDERHSVVTEFPEIIRLRVLREIDDLDDLHAMARVNKTFYDTYKVHELYLMRCILRRVDRQRAGSSVAKPTNLRSLEEKVKKDDADIMKELHTGFGRDAVTIRSEDEDDDQDYEMDSDLETSDPSEFEEGSRSNARSEQGSSEGPTTSSYEADFERAHTNGRRSSHTAPKPIVTHHESTEDLEPPMTEEEAHRILWPDQFRNSSPARSVAMPVADGEAISEKFLARDKVMFESREEKLLVGIEDKQLRSEHDERIGLRKSARRPETRQSQASKNL